MLLCNIEYPGSLILTLLKADDIMMNISEKTEAFYKTNFENDNNIQTHFKNFVISNDKIKIILEKFKKKIDHECADIKFSQTIEVMFC